MRSGSAFSARQHAEDGSARAALCVRSGRRRRATGKSFHGPGCRVRSADYRQRCKARSSDFAGSWSRRPRGSEAMPTQDHPSRHRRAPVDRLHTGQGPRLTGTPTALRPDVLDRAIASAGPSALARLGLRPGRAACARRSRLGVRLELVPAGGAPLRDDAFGAHFRVCRPEGAFPRLGSIRPSSCATWTSRTRRGRSARSHFIRARRVAMTVAWRSLGSDLTVINLIELEDAQVDMERQASGVRNWRLGHPEDTGPPKVLVLRLAAQRSAVWAHRRRRRERPGR